MTKIPLILKNNNSLRILGKYTSAQQTTLNYLRSLWVLSFFFRYHFHIFLLSMFLLIWIFYWKRKWVISCRTGKNRYFTWLQQVQSKRKKAKERAQEVCVRVCVPMHPPICATSEELHPYRSTGESHLCVHDHQQSQRHMSTTAPHHNPAGVSLRRIYNR